MLSRRDTVRALGLAGLAGLAGPPLLTACGSRASSTEAPGAAPRFVGSRVPRSTGEPAQIPGVVSALGRFSTDLWGRIGEPSADLALSPYSIMVALAMTANGAVGRTQAQMLGAMQVPSLSAFNRGADALTQAVEALAGPVKLPDGTDATIALASANQLFGDVATLWAAPFLNLLSKEYGAGMRTVDFRHDPEGARTRINAWTAARTHDRIPTILPEGVVDPFTRLVLVNALYFKAPWGTQFQKSATTAQPFHRADGSTVSVDMMDGTPDQGAYLTGDHYSGARLPYAGGTLAMTVALPDPGHEDRALAALLAGGLTASGEGGVHVRLPRFSFRTPTDLKPLLQQMGMRLALTDGADFSGMTTDEALHVSAVLHQAFVAVDENGTEAAAATAVGMQALSGVAAQHDVVCDRPFLFAIHDTKWGTPLFVGRVADPSGS